ncbi:GNAT family N-acetyltransferase [Micromonospora echinofusca]|uniref:GNAT family N-acetyltransferase n=1 Tax=Micromonospora echinofusca TaxID=47858 RepID=A0ABS3VRE1_MICEH|nr:GNAT family N-acetyltransferase [Micromonospora echinofusca]MBO4207066.1 GNAT family N-acetyltransferase [Micromonospora echinofusca]
MSINIRDFEPADAVGVADVFRAAMPYHVLTAEAVAWQATSAPEAQRYRLFVAEDDGGIIGAARTGLLFETDEPGLAFANVSVHPERRGRGAGTALLTAAEEYLAGLDARTVHSWVGGDPGSTAFAERHGYQRGRRACFQRLDIASRALRPAPAPRDVVRLVTAVEFATDPRPLYEADLAAARDEPGDVATVEISYEDWLALYWDRPDFDQGLSTVAMVEDVVAAFTIVAADGRDRYWSGMTGTRREFRGQGLAKLVKHDSLRRARAGGYRWAFTNNDAANEPMLAINRWFGYRPVAEEWRYRRSLSG